LKVLLDNNLSPYLARSLNVLLEPEGDQVAHLTELFPPGIEDRTWMSTLAEKGGWIVISADRQIFRNRLEREVWRRGRLVVFFLAQQWSHARNVEIAWRLLRWWPRIRDQVAIVAAPAAFEVPFAYRAGRLKVLPR
jgi:hypothetical protein